MPTGGGGRLSHPSHGSHLPLEVAREQAKMGSAAGDTQGLATASHASLPRQLIARPQALETPTLVHRNAGDLRLGRGSQAPASACRADMATEVR
jgi:hypothetical protein